MPTERHATYQDPLRPMPPSAHKRIQAWYDDAERINARQRQLTLAWLAAVAVGAILARYLFPALGR